MNIMREPKLIKIVVNTGLGEARENKKVIDVMSESLAQITGQRPIVTYARRDISVFKLRRGDAIGLKVTLRGKRMFDFLGRLVKIVLPRIRDFRGCKRSGFDGRGGYTLGLLEHIVFPEIDYSKIDKPRGCEVTFVTTAKDKEKTEALLTKLGMPFAPLRGAQGKP